jgi:O-antigen ligase
VFKDRFITKDVVDDSGRFELFKLALNTFFDKFLFGNGLNSGKYMISNNLDNWVAHYHNFILQIASALGIIGLILFGFIVLRWIKILFKPKDAFLTCSAISIIGGLTHQLLDVSFDLFYFGVYFYGIIAIAEIYRHYNVDEKLKFIAINKLIKNSDNINNNK